MAGTPVTPADTPIEPVPAPRRRDRWLVLGSCAVVGGLTLALWMIYGPAVFGAMISGFYALCF